MSATPVPKPATPASPAAATPKVTENPVKRVLYATWVFWPWAGLALTVFADLLIDHDADLNKKAQAAGLIWHAILLFGCAMSVKKVHGITLGRLKDLAFYACILAFVGVVAVVVAKILNIHMSDIWALFPGLTMPEGMTCSFFEFLDYQPRFWNWSFKGATIIGAGLVVGALLTAGFNVGMPKFKEVPKEDRGHYYVERYFSRGLVKFIIGSLLLSFAGFIVLHGTIPPQCKAGYVAPPTAADTTDHDKPQIVTPPVVTADHNDERSPSRKSSTTRAPAPQPEATVPEDGIVSVTSPQVTTHGHGVVGQDGDGNVIVLTY